MQSDQGRVDQQGSRDCLEDTDDRCLFTGLFQSGKTELTADREGDKTKGRCVDDADILHCLVRDKSQAFNARSAQAIRTDQKSRDQKGGNIREISSQQFKYTGEHQTREQSDGNRKKNIHKTASFCLL